MDFVDSMYESRATTVARDLKLNLKRLLVEGALAHDEALLALLATATSVGETRLAEAARAELKARDMPAEVIQEAAESAAIMAMLNSYYRFKHMVNDEESYKTAGLRMTALARPALGRERFEMLAFAVSVLNGCEMCIRSHEKELRNHGLGVDKIHDLARLAAVVKGLATLEAA